MPVLKFAKLISSSYLPVKTLSDVERRGMGMLFVILLFNFKGDRVTEF